MKTVDINKNNNNSSPLDLSPKNDTPSTSFASLLNEIKDTNQNKISIIQDTVLSLCTEDTKENTKSSKDSNKKDLLSLLKIIENPKTKQENSLVELNPKITTDLTHKELISLIQNAKKYLKSKISNSIEFKNQEIKSLPKTLKGLVKIAKKLNINISKITVEKLEISQEKDNKYTEILLSDKVKKNTPIFKAQTKNKITTQEIVQVKTIKQTSSKEKNQKSKQTLELLLQGETNSKKNNTKVTLTPDFSVATSKVIASTLNKQEDEEIKSILKEPNKQEDPSFKTDIANNISKADSFEVKLIEAKQMMKYLSNDIKTAIDNYKSPFTRVKVQLNPQKLGEIDLTIVQRGKNLHINLSSNNTAINTLAMNANDLKIQLNNNGINNASLNFNNTSDSSFGSQAQQQQQQKEEAKHEYDYFKDEENKKDNLSSLELVIPYYV